LEDGQKLVTHTKTLMIVGRQTTMEQQTENYLNSAGIKISEACSSVVKLSTGALALSIAFQGNIKGQDASHLWILATSWVLLTLPPICFVFLKLLDAKNDLFWFDQHRALENATDVSKIDPISDVPNEVKDINKIAKLSYKSLLISFVLGIVSLMSFAIINMETTANQEPDPRWESRSVFDRPELEGLKTRIKEQWNAEPSEQMEHILEKCFQEKQ